MAFGEFVAAGGAYYTSEHARTSSHHFQAPAIFASVLPRPLFADHPSVLSSQVLHVPRGYQLRQMGWRYSRGDGLHRLVWLCSPSQRKRLT